MKAIQKPKFIDHGKDSHGLFLSNSNNLLQYNKMSNRGEKL